MRETLGSLSSITRAAAVAACAAAWALDAHDGDVTGRVSSECRDVARDAGEHDGIRAGTSEGDDDRVSGRDLRRSPGRRAQPRSFAGLQLVDGTDLTSVQHTVAVEVTPVIRRERLSQDDSGDLRRPKPAPAKLDEPRSMTGERAHPAGVQYQRHADRA